MSKTLRIVLVTGLVLVAAVLVVFVLPGSPDWADLTSLIKIK